MSGTLALSVDDVVEALDVSRDVVYRAIKRGEIPAVHVGTRVLIPRRWLEDLFATSAAAVADALSNPTDIASASGTAGSTAQRPTPHPADDPTTDLAGGTSGPALHSTG